MLSITRCRRQRGDDHEAHPNCSGQEEWPGVLIAVVMELCQP
jgi:RNA polymerase subunit RPABC4/transcription elongation factor Spt4